MYVSVLVIDIVILMPRGTQETPETFNINYSHKYNVQHDTIRKSKGAPSLPSPPHYISGLLKDIMQLIELIDTVMVVYWYKQ